MNQRTASIYPRVIKVAAPPASTLLWLWGPLLLAASINPLIRLFDGRLPVQATFASWGPVLFLPLVAAVLTVAYRRRRITLDQHQLDIVSTLYRKQIPLSSMRMERARVVDFAEYPDFKPAIKTNGYQMPGFRSGHFRMKDGGKGFCLITDDSRVLVLPLRDGSSVLISPEQPRALLDELKRLADNNGRA